MPDSLATGQVTLATVWLLGVSMGMTACTVTCLPFIGTWALGRASGRSEAFLHTGVFLAGRVIAYAALAALAGTVGTRLANMLGGNLGNAAIGIVSLVSGLWLLRRPVPACGVRLPRPTANGRQPIRFRRKRDSLPPLLLGAALSLTPCTPLASLLALAANASSPTQGAALGLAFGLGVAMTPILVLVPLAGRLGREIKSGRAWLSRWLALVAAGVLILLGLRRLWPLLPASWW